jgi:hypothetical protein
MEIKKFKCTICGAEVTKPKSYAVPGGRACRTHQEAISENEKREKSRQQSLNAHSDEVKFERHKEWKAPFAPAGIVDPNSYCWHCKKSGVDEKIMYMRLLVNHSKVEQKGFPPQNPFDPMNQQFLQTREDLKGLVILKRFPLDEKYPDWKLKQLVQTTHEKGKISDTLVPKISGLINLCVDCCKKFEFDWDWNKPKNPPKLETMMMIGSMMKPTFDKIAQDEILDETEKREVKS